MDASGWLIYLNEHLCLFITNQQNAQFSKLIFYF